MMMAGPGGGKQKPEHDDLDDRVGRHEQLEEREATRGGRFDGVEGVDWLRFRLRSATGSRLRARVSASAVRTPGGESSRHTARQQGPVLMATLMAHVELAAGRGPASTRARQQRARPPTRTRSRTPLPSSTRLRPLRTGHTGMQCGGNWASPLPLPVFTGRRKTHAAARHIPRQQEFGQAAPVDGWAGTRPDVTGGSGLPSCLYRSIASSTIWQSSANTCRSSSP